MSENALKTGPLMDEGGECPTEVAVKTSPASGRDGGTDDEEGPKVACQNRRPNRPFRSEQEMKEARELE
jgi:hypothetical protein